MGGSESSEETPVPTKEEEQSALDAEQLALQRDSLSGVNVPFNRVIRDGMPAITELQLPTKIPLSELMTESAEVQKTFCLSIKQRGYALINVDVEETRNAFKEFERSLEEYFLQPADVKALNLDEDKNNLGYVTCGSIREYIKLRPTDTENLWPTMESFKPAYSAMFSQYLEMAFTAFKLLATYMDKEDAKQSTLIPPESYDAITEFLRIKSSLSGIRYYKQEPNTEVCDEHTDTGILTFITKTQIPSLEMWDRTVNKYVKLEELVGEGDVIIFPGEKIPLFSQSKQWLATPHRVRNPTGEERTSIAFLLDVAK